MSLPDLRSKSEPKHGVFVKDPVTRQETLLGHFDSEGVIGKSAESDILLKDLRCDSLHAWIQPHATERGTYTLVDLGSHFGTFYKKKRIQEAEVRQGDIFQIGTQWLVIRETLLTAEDIQSIQIDRSKKNANLTSKETALDLASDQRLLQVTLFWGDQVLEMRTFYPGTDVTLGNTMDSTFQVTLADQQKSRKTFRIAQYKSDELLLKIPREANGLIWKGPQPTSIDKMRHLDSKNKDFGMVEISLKNTERADIHIGELMMSFRFVPPTRSIPFQWPRLEKHLVIALGILFLFYGSLFTYITTSQPNEEEAVKTLKDVPKQLKRILYDAGIEQGLKKQQAAIGELVSQLEGGRARGEEGKVSASRSEEKVEVQKPVEKVDTKKPSKSAPKTQLKRSNQATRKAELSEPALDLDAAFSASPSSKKSVSQTAHLVGKRENGNAAAAITGGNFARGSKGIGGGGGGTSVGIGELKGYSTGGGLGTGDYGLSPSKGREIRVPDSEEIVILGGLDPDVIASIIKRYLPQIQHCYEQQLALNPTLKGKVTVAFTIGGTGSVSKASIADTTLRNKAAESCITKKIMNWKFPKPRGGGTVGVKYPFLLMSSSAK